jgi:hypothetical protein
MKRGTIRLIGWEPQDTNSPATKIVSAVTPGLPAEILPVGEAPEVTPPNSAAAEAKLLLRIAAEVEGALMVEYLYAAYSLLPNVIVNAPAIDHPIMSDDWYDAIRDVAKQEMGHLLTVQNLLLSLNATPHMDRENFPIQSDLYPFAFHLQALSQDTLAKGVAAEAPRDVRAEDRADYQTAVAAAVAAAGGKVSRVGQIYERLYFLFQDTDTPQSPWTTVVNPFPGWTQWHVDRALVGFNQDRQAEPSEWRGADGTASPDTAVYVMPVSDKASAREAIYRVALQGEGPPSGEPGQTHFDKFLRIYREFRAYKAVPGAPAMIRTQALDPTTTQGATGGITDPTTLLWANLANLRYQMLLLDIALALSIGTIGSVPGTTAARRDFIAWAFGVEMLTSIKKLGEELRAMPLHVGSATDSMRAGLPFEVPGNRDLPSTVPEQVAELRKLVADSQVIRQRIRDEHSPTPRQLTLLTVLENADKSISAKIGSVA